MDVIRKHINIDNKRLFDTSMIYSRVMVLMDSRDINLKDVLAYELSPVPTSIFEDSDEMRFTKNKSVLKNKLKEETLARTALSPDIVVVDGCALMWVISWPVTGSSV